MPGGGAERVGRAAAFILNVTVIGLMSIALAVSVAMIVYQGPLSTHVGRAIALTLVGAVPMGVIGARMLRGAVCSPQNSVAAVTALFAASVMASAPDPPSERAFATVSAFIAATALATGLTAWLLGRLHLGALARYLPFPVVSGFLAATGYLLVSGGMGTAVGRRLSLTELGALFAPDMLPRWLPWAAVAVVIVSLTRRLRQPLVLPIGLLLSGVGFYAVLYGLGMGLEDARRAGLLIGPFGDSFLRAFAGWRPLDIDGWALARGIPTLLTAVGLAIVSSVMAASSIELISGIRTDLDRELRGVGVANAAAALGGGAGGLHSLALTQLTVGLGMRGSTGGLIAAAAAALALAFGAPVIGALPSGLFASGIMVIGLNMMLGPVFDHRRITPLPDYLIVLMIPVVTALFGFLWGVAVGLLTATLSFVVAFARVDVLRLATTGARLRSRVERPDAEQARLAVLGPRVAVYGLEGFLFFGTADRLVQRIEAALDGAANPEHVLLDFRRVRGLDSSAARALARIEEICRARGVKLRFAALAGATEHLIRHHAPGATFVPTLDQALEEAEAELLAADGAVADGTPDLVEELRRRHPAVDLDTYFASVSVPAEAEVIAQGAPSDSLLVLRSGALRIEVAVGGVAPVVVARCPPGALVGEIGLYAGIPRTARVVSEKPSTFLSIDAAALERMGREHPALLADFHRLIAATLARRLGRTTALLADAEILAR